jgi:hypothetical protein
MEEKTAGDPADSDGAAGDLFGLPDWPSLTKRWTGNAGGSVPGRYTEHSASASIIM